MPAYWQKESRNGLPVTRGVRRYWAFQTLVCCGRTMKTNHCHLVIRSNGKAFMGSRLLLLGMVLAMISRNNNYHSWALWRYPRILRKNLRPMNYLWKKRALIQIAPREQERLVISEFSNKSSTVKKVWMPFRSTQTARNGNLKAIGLRIVDHNFSLSML